MSAPNDTTSAAWRQTRRKEGSNCSSRFPSKSTEAREAASSIPRAHRKHPDGREAGWLASPPRSLHLGTCLMTGLLIPTTILSHPPGLKKISLPNRNPLANTATGRTESFGFSTRGFECLEDGSGGGWSSSKQGTVSAHNVSLSLLKGDPRGECQKPAPGAESLWKWVQGLCSPLLSGLTRQSAKKPQRRGPEGSVLAHTCQMPFTTVAPL